MLRRHRPPRLSMMPRSICDPHIEALWLDIQHIERACATASVTRPPPSLGHSRAHDGAIDSNAWRTRERCAIRRAPADSIATPRIDADRKRCAPSRRGRRIQNVHNAEAVAQRRGSRPARVAHPPTVRAANHWMVSCTGPFADHVSVENLLAG